MQPYADTSRTRIYGYEILLLFFLQLFFAAFHSYPVQGPGNDQETFRYAGMMLTKGFVPYADFFDHKPPLVYFFYGLANPLGLWGPLVLFTLLSFFVSIFVFRFCKKRTGSYAWPLILLWMALMKYYLVMAGGGQNRELNALFIMLGCCIAADTMRSYKWMLQGLISFLIFFTQQTDMPAYLLFLALLFFKKENASGATERFRNLCAYAAGLLLPTVLLLGYFWQHRALDEFIAAAFTFNSKTYIDYGIIPQKLPFVIVVLIKSGFVFWVAASVFLSAPPYKKEALMLMGCFLVQLLCILPGYYFMHYFISFIPYVFLSMVLLVRVERERRLLPRWLMLPVFLFILGWYIHPLYWMKKRTEITEKKEWVNLLRPYAASVAGKRGQLFVFDHPALLLCNSQYKIPGPSRWLYFHFWLWPHWDQKLDTFNTEIIEPLDRYRCRYIVDRESDIFAKRPELKQLWKNYTDKKYQVIFEQKSAQGEIVFRLLQRKEI